MTVFAVAAAVAAGVLLAITSFLGASLHRRRRAAVDGVAAAVERLSTQIEGIVRELEPTLHRAQKEGRRNRFLVELAGSIDLDEVLERTLQAAQALSGADAALLTVDQPGATPLAATLGLSADEAERQVIAAPPDGGDVRSISLVFRYTDDEVRSRGSVVRGGVAVPVRGDTAQLGLLTVLTRSAKGTFDEDVVAELEVLARHAGPLIDSARRFREARQLADLDALTGLHNRRYFHETLAREVARAHRYGRMLSLIVFDVDDFKQVNDRIGHLAGDSVLAEVADRVRSVVRTADVACRIGGDEFAVIMPESSVGDADQLSRRLHATVAARPIAQAGRLALSAGIAEVLQSDDATSFFERADEALYRAKEEGKGRVVAAGG